MTEERCPSSRIRRIAASAPSADQAATGSPGPGQAERAGDADGVTRVVVDGEQVGGAHPLGDVGGGRGRRPGRGGPGCRPRSPWPARPGRAARPGGPARRRPGRRPAPRCRRRSWPRDRTRSGGRTSARSRSTHAGLGEVAQRGDEGLAVARAARAARRRRRAPARERCRPRWQHGDAVAEGEQRVLRGRGGAVGQGDDVVVRHESGDPVGGNVARVHLDAARRARGSAASSRTRRPASPHSSPATVRRRSGTSRRASTRRSTPL